MSATEPSALPDLAAIGDELLGTTSVTGDRPGAIRAVGWATVDLDRAAAELATRWPGLAPWETAPPEPLLGARALVARVGAPLDGPGAIALVLLEPTTEGRLAAALARHGEGPTAVWIAPEHATNGAPRPPSGAIADGPLGPERLLAGSPVAGPHVLLLERPPGTIDR